MPKVYITNNKNIDNKAEQAGSSHDWMGWLFKGISDHHL